MENKIEIREKSTLFSVQFEIAHKEPSISYTVHSIKDMIIAYQSTCILALRMRMQHCMQSLMRHQNDIIQANKDVIVYTRDDSSVTHFSVPAYEAMQRFLEDLQDETINSTSTYFYLAITQLVKALYWVDIKPEGFGKLISCLVDYLATGGYEK